MWSNIVKQKDTTTPTAAPMAVKKAAAIAADPAAAPNMQPPAPVETRSFAFAASASKSWASVVHRDTSTPSSSSSFSKVQVSRAQDLKKIEFDLESSRAGLNLAFKNVVSTSSMNSAATPGPSSTLRTETPTTGRAAAKFAASSIANASKTSGDVVEKEVKPLTDAQVAKREKQISYGKNTVGYTNYINHVKKSERESGNERHPQTPKPNSQSIRSKRQFAGAVKMWKKALHMWDDAGSCNAAEMKATATAGDVDTTTETAAGAGAKKGNVFKRAMRTKSWADMADSDDSDSDDEEMADAKPPSPEFQGLRTKRKATEELLPARMEKKANTKETEDDEAQPTKKPMSRALQLAKERAAARKAAAATKQ